MRVYFTSCQLTWPCDRFSWGSLRPEHGKVTCVSNWFMWPAIAYPARHNRGPTKSVCLPLTTKSSLRFDPPLPGSSLHRAKVKWNSVLQSSGSRAFWVVNTVVSSRSVCTLLPRHIWMSAWDSAYSGGVATSGCQVGLDEAEVELKS